MNTAACAANAPTQSTPNLSRVPVIIPRTYCSERRKENVPGSSWSLQLVRT